MTRTRSNVARIALAASTLSISLGAVGALAPAATLAAPVQATARSSVSLAAPTAECREGAFSDGLNPSVQYDGPIANPSWVWHTAPALAFPPGAVVPSHPAWVYQAEYSFSILMYVHDDNTNTDDWKYVDQPGSVTLPCGNAAPEDTYTSDFTGDLNDDIVARSSSGDLLLYPHTPSGFGTSRKIGNGWQYMTALIAGDFTGDGYADIVARTGAGSLLLYPHTPAGFGTSSVMSSSGWNSMTSLIACDFNTDGYTDIVAVDSAGTMWNYPHVPGGFNARAQIGTGWSGMTAILCGDFNGDGLEDIVARTSAGHLLFYQHATGGLVVNAVDISQGINWNSFTALVAGDFNGDGNVDIVARDGAADLWLYPHTPSGGFGSPTKIGNGWQYMTAIL